MKRLDGALIEVDPIASAGSRISAVLVKFIAAAVVLGVTLIAMEKSRGAAASLLRQLDCDFEVGDLNQRAEKEGGSAWKFHGTTLFSLSRTSARTHSPPAAVFDP
ncbi:hypothetical protein [Povalibacter sp.]|uniref:hypothetical protein n=1 Tax=Povalibacter sp. TaxID=1962978 RepID=UPI002F410820